MKFIVVILLVFCNANVNSDSTSKESSLIKIDDQNWDQFIMSGEWMIEFQAPWCPACRNLQPVWEEFSGWSKDLGIQVGQIDITKSPGLSGRFMITALPTIYHVKDGVFRQYKGPRTKEDFLSFIEEKKWNGLPTLSSWQAPSSLQMSLVSQFYKISMALRNVMNILLEDYGVPVWGAYLLFGVVTILIGLVLGLTLVCIIDFFYPPKKFEIKQDSPSQSSKELINDDLPDDDSPSVSEQQQENEQEPEQETTRKRKTTRKAD